MAKLFQADVKMRILAEYLSGVGVKDIAARYGCHQTYPGQLAKKRGEPARCANRSAGMREYWREREWLKAVGTER